jgi:hypothetical protein
MDSGISMGGPGVRVSASEASRGAWYDPAPHLSVEESRLLGAAGVHLVDGQLLWPVALRVLPGTAPLRQRIEALIEEEAAQSAIGAVNAHVYLDLVAAVDTLNSLMQRERDTRGSLPSSAYEEAELFLAGLKGAATRLAQGYEPAPRPVRVTPAK